jgi:DNA segregation ATPase FtsK/SpoIIIE-like protein
MRLIGMLLIPVAFFVLISLATYSVNDYPNASRRPEEALNIGGRAGALVAFTLFVLLGYCAYGIPLLIGLFAWNRLKNQNPRLLPVILGVGLGFIAAGAMTVSLVSAIPESRRFEFGGALGIWLGRHAAGILGVQGALAASTALLLLMVVLSIAGIRRYRARQRIAARMRKDRSNLYDTAPMSRSSPP